MTILTLLVFILVVVLVAGALSGLVQSAPETFLSPRSKWFWHALIVVVVCIHRVQPGVRPGLPRPAVRAPVIRPHQLPRAVVLLAFRDGKVLSVLRPNGGRVLVGGKVEAGESLLAALHRETREEAGVVPTNPREVLTYIVEGEVTYLCTAYACDGVVGEPSSEEETDPRFVDLIEPLKGRFAPQVRRIYEAVGLTVML